MKISPDDATCRMVWHVQAADEPTVRIRFVDPNEAASDGVPALVQDDVSTRMVALTPQTRFEMFSALRKAAASDNVLLNVALLPGEHGRGCVRVLVLSWQMFLQWFAVQSRDNFAKILDLIDYGMRPSVLFHLHTLLITLPEWKHVFFDRAVLAFDD